MQISCKEEDLTIDAIAAISAIDPKTVRKVFEGMSIYSAMESYKGATEFVYPFVGKVSVAFHDELDSQTSVTKKATGTISLFEGFSSLMGDAKQGKFSQIKEFVQSRFKRSLKDLVELG